MKNWFSLRLYHWETNHSKGWVLCPAADAQHKSNSAAALEAVSQCCVRHFCFKPYSPLRVYYALQFCIFMKFLCANVHVSVSICFLRLSLFLQTFPSLCLFPIPVCFHFILLLFLRYLFSKRQKECRLDGKGWSWRRGNHSQIMCKKICFYNRKGRREGGKKESSISQEAWVSRGL